jgi:hypothetical protein
MVYSQFLNIRCFFFTRIASNGRRNRLLYLSVTISYLQNRIRSPRKLSLKNLFLIGIGEAPNVYEVQK